MIQIDGSVGEGGGQVFRSSLALSLATGEPFTMHSIRAGRKRPGLMRQHLACALAAQAVSAAEMKGATVGSTGLVFRPGKVQGGDYHFAVGSAGSCLLVLQTVLMPLLQADTPSTLVLEGGTHNAMSPPFESVAGALVPLLERMGARIDLSLERHGFYPAGGGRMSVRLTPPRAFSRLELLHRGAVLSRTARALVANLPMHIAERELNVFSGRIKWDREPGDVVCISNADGPGNVLMAKIVSENSSELITAFGERGLSAEKVGAQVAREVERFVAGDVPVGEHLADQLLLPMALAKGGAFRTLKPSLHTTTQMDVIRIFLGATISAAEVGPDDYLVSVN